MSRISQRSRKKEKFRRHIASLSANDSDSKDIDSNTGEDAPGPAATNVATTTNKSSYPLPKQQIGYVATTSPYEDSEGFSMLYPYQRRSIQSLPWNPYDDSMESSSTAHSHSNTKKTSSISRSTCCHTRKPMIHHIRSLPTNHSEDYSASLGSSASTSKEPNKNSSIKKNETESTTAVNATRFWSRMVNRARSGKSLTKAPSVDSKSRVRSSSISSETSEKQEPPRIATTRTRPGRSLTRTPLVNSKAGSAAGSTAATSKMRSSTASSRNLPRPPSRPAGSNLSEKSEEEATATATAAPKASSLSSRFHSRSLSRGRVALYRRSYSEDGTDKNQQPLKSSTDSEIVGAIRPVTGRSAFSKIMAEKQASRSVKKKPSKSKSKKKILPANANVTETESATAEECAAESKKAPLVMDDSSSPAVEKECSNEMKLPHKSVLFDEYGDPPLDNMNISFLSHENIEKRVVGNIIVDEYGDPPLEEMESEVSVGAFDNNMVAGSIQNYLPSGNLLGSFAATNSSEVKPESTGFSSSGLAVDHHVDEKKDEQSQSIEADAIIAIIEENMEREVEALELQPIQNTSWDLTSSQFSNIVSSATKSRDDDMDVIFDTASWVAGTKAEFSDVAFSNVLVNEDSESHFVKLMMEEEKNYRNQTEDEEEMLTQTQQNLAHAEDDTEDKIDIDGEKISYSDFSQYANDEKKAKKEIIQEEQIVSFPSDNDDIPLDTTSTMSSDRNPAKLEVATLSTLLRVRIRGKLLFV